MNSRPLNHSLPRRLAAPLGLGLAAVLATSTAMAQGQTVTTTAGEISGMASEYDAGVQVFLGIPYGADTGGENRFRPPQPVTPWEGTREATKLGDACVGLGYPPFLMPEEGADLDTSPMSEDCLRLNVWTPATDDGKRAVMVWFHGGGYTSGSGGSVRYDGTNLAKKQDVVLVTVNHRLGALGFMDLSAVGGDPDSGNAGMLDIVQALQWVQDNIAAFGGDPERVMVFGESGGGGKVTTLLSMPGAKGLFQRAVAESGLQQGGIPAEAGQKTAAEVMETLGVADVAALQAVPTEDLLKAGGNWGPVIGPSFPRGPFQPDVDTLSADVPLIIGSNATEAVFFNVTPVDPLPDDAALKEAFAKNPFAGSIPAENVDSLLASYGEIFPKKAPHELLQVIATDAWMTGQVQATADARSGAGQPTWVYHFAMPQGARDGKLGAPHTAEIAYVFDNLDLSTALVGEPDDDDRALAGLVSSYWATFAKTGMPAADGGPDWPQWTPENRAVLVLDADTGVETDPFSARLDALGAARN